MKKLSILITLIVFSFLLGCTQNGAMKDDVEKLKEGQANIIKELGEVKKLLQARTPPKAKAQEFKEAVINIGDDPFKGEKLAKVTIVEFTDYQWPYCARHVRGTYKEIEKEYIETGKVKYVVMDFPLESIHPKAFKAHEAANCAYDQGKYWEMHNKIFENTRAISPDDLVKNAEAVGLDIAAFKECLDGGKYTAEIRNDISQGQKAGMRGTPSFFIGLTDPKDTTKFKATKFIRGAQGFSGFKPAIDELLSSK